MTKVCHNSLSTFSLMQIIEPRILPFIVKTGPCNIQHFTSVVKISVEKKINIFHIFAQNIDCGYPLEQPQ